MKVILNNSAYEVQEGARITRQPLNEFPQHIRTTGQQTRDSRSLMSAWWIEDFESGYGCEKVNLSSARQVKSFWDSESNTSFQGQVTNPAKVNTVLTHSQYPPKWIYEYNGSIWGLYYSNKTQDDQIKAHVLQWKGTYWSYFASANFPTVGRVTNDFQYKKGIPRALISGRSEANKFVHEIELAPTPIYSLDFASTACWNDITLDVSRQAVWMPAYSGWAVMGTENSDVAGDARIKLLSGTSAISTLKYSANGVNNMRPFMGQDGYEGLFLFYDNVVTCLEGIGSVVAEVPYVDLKGDASDDTGRDLAVFDNKLIFPVRDALLAYAPNGDITDIGLNRFSGLPTNKQGNVTSLAYSLRALFAGIFREGKTEVYQYRGNAWHWLGRTASIGTTASLYILSDDGVSRLWHGGFGAGTCSYVNYPFDNPLHCTAYGYEASSYFIPPQYDGALPNIKGVAFGLAIDGDFGSQCYVDAYYATDGSTIYGYLGKANQSGVNVLSFGTGAPHTRFQPKFNLIGNETQTPVLRSAVLEYLRFPTAREIFTVPIDLAKSAFDLSSIKALLLKLQEAADSLTLIPFQYGAYATVNVKIMEMPLQEEILENPESIFTNEGAGLVTVRAIELYPG